MESLEKPCLIGMTLEELQDVALEGGMPKYVGKQLADWIYSKRATDFDEMGNISKKNKEWLKTHYEVGRRPAVSEERSADGTVKYLFRVNDGKKIESVYIPDRERATLCVSSQIGCKMNCYFCATGKLGFKGNLKASDIINQILSIPPKGSHGMTELTNVVFMGMGEPLDNLKSVLRTIEILTSPWGLGWSPKRITVSTVGKMPELKELLDKTQVHIAVSLHSADQGERAAMMPAQKSFPISSVIKLLKGYDFSHQRRLSMEYIVWKGVNDDIAHADQIVRLLSGLDCRVNLIRFHSVDGVKLQPASEERMLMMRNHLNSKGITATIRTSRGEDISAACGQLAAKSGRKEK